MPSFLFLFLCFSDMTIKLGRVNITENNIIQFSFSWTKLNSSCFNEWFWSQWTKKKRPFFLSFFLSFLDYFFSFFIHFFFVPLNTPFFQTLLTALSLSLSLSLSIFAYFFFLFYLLFFPLSLPSIFFYHFYVSVSNDFLIRKYFVNGNIYPFFYFFSFFL